MVTCFPALFEVVSQTQLQTSLTLQWMRSSSLKLADISGEKNLLKSGENIFNRETSSVFLLFFMVMKCFGVLVQAILKQHLLPSESC